jgi:nucleoside-diphosphate-sugar epimerase
MSVTIIQNNRESSLFVIFGSGLIGSEIIRTTSIFCAEPVKTQINFDWEDSEELKGVISQLMNSARHENIKKVEIFWCAGRAGFFASQEEMHKETLTFCAVVSQFEEEDRITVYFNLLSSAGGLYEGCSGRVNSRITPMPVRPYGESKLEQERILKTSKVLYRIYRPTTVYGRVSTGARSGLISTLISNTLNQASTTIHASPNTLRDYIYVRDIAKIVVLNGMFRSEAGKAYIIASGRPVSIYHLLEMVRLALGKRPRVNFIPSLGNDQNINFAGVTHPNLASFTSLEEGVRLLAHQQGLYKS